MGDHGRVDDSWKKTQPSPPVSEPPMLNVRGQAFHEAAKEAGILMGWAVKSSRRLLEQSK
jgi:hypothetical protein